MVWAQLAAAGIGAASSILGANAQQKAERERFQKVLELLQKAQGIGQTYGDAALQQQTKGLADIQGGFGAALAETTNAGRSAESDLLQQFRGATSASEQNLVSSGMYHPQAIADAKRGLIGPLARAIDSIRSGTAQDRSRLLTGQGLATAGQRGNIAGQYNTNASRLMGATENVADLYGQRPPVSGDASGAIGTLAGALGSVNWSSLFSRGGTSTPPQGNNPYMFGFKAPGK